MTSNKLGKTVKRNIGKNKIKGLPDKWQDVDFMYNKMKKGELLGVESTIPSNMGREIFSDGHGGRYSLVAERINGVLKTQNVSKFRTPDRIMQVRGLSWSDTEEGEDLKEVWLSSFEEGGENTLKLKAIEEKLDEIEEARNIRLSKKTSKENLDKEKVKLLYEQQQLKEGKTSLAKQEKLYEAVDIVVENGAGKQFNITMESNGKIELIELTDKKEVSPESIFIERKDYFAMKKHLDGYQKPNTSALIKTILVKNDDLKKGK